jgi:hypothetical protein
MTAVANSTFGHEVFRGDGTRLYGLDAEVERKVVNGGVVVIIFICHLQYHCLQQHFSLTFQVIYLIYFHFINSCKRNETRNLNANCWHGLKR